MIKLITIIALLLCFGCNGNKIFYTSAEKESYSYGYILTSISCPIFINWLQSDVIIAKTKRKTDIAHARKDLNCYGEHSYNRKTASHFIRLPIGNYRIIQDQISHIFKLEYMPQTKIDFKIKLHRITYIGDINITAATSKYNKNQKEIKITVIDNMAKRMADILAKSSFFIKDYPKNKAIWQPVIKYKLINQKPYSEPKGNLLIIDRSPYSFFN